MPKSILRLDIFISSPSDVSPERELVLRVIERLNRLAYIRERYLLHPLVYEGEVPPAVGDPAQTVVDNYMTEAKDSYLVVCILWARMGTPFTHPITQQQWKSGTLYEFTTAYQSRVDRGTPQILLYRKTAANPDANPDQHALVKQFFESFKGEDKLFDGLYKRYQTLAEFEQMVFEHIERVLHENPPEALTAQATPIEMDRPRIKEERRRLDAAMPSSVNVGHPTEVRAMLILPDSDGLRALLPDTTESGETIRKGDVRVGSLSVAYPVDPATGQTQPVTVTVMLRGADFDIPEAEQRLYLHAGTDSGQLTFTLTPTRARPRSIVHVTVRAHSPDGYEVTLGSAALSTAIQPVGMKAAARVVWSVLSLPLSAVAVSLRPGNQTMFPAEPEEEKPSSKALGGLPQSETEEMIHFGDVESVPRGARDAGETDMPKFEDVEEDKELITGTHAAIADEEERITQEHAAVTTEEERITQEHAAIGDEAAPIANDGEDPVFGDWPANGPFSSTGTIRDEAAKPKSSPAFGNSGLDELDDYDFFDDDDLFAGSSETESRSTPPRTTMSKAPGYEDSRRVNYAQRKSRFSPIFVFILIIMVPLLISIVSGVSFVAERRQRLNAQATLQMLEGTNGALIADATATAEAHATQTAIIEATLNPPTVNGGG